MDRFYLLTICRLKLLAGTLLSLALPGRSVNPVNMPAFTKMHLCGFLLIPGSWEHHIDRSTLPSAASASLAASVQLPRSRSEANWGRSSSPPRGHVSYAL